jgi:hypothetical protein
VYIKDNIVYSPSQVREILNASFSDNVDLSELGYFKFEPSLQPEPLENHRVVGRIENNQQVWEQVPLTNEEINARLEALRAEAYREESDPLFFKWQRGEATQQQWLDKVAEIKARYV